MSNMKHCPRCNCSTIIRYGIRSGRQRYCCKSCGAVWSNTRRPQKMLNAIWHDFVFDGLRITDLSDKYHISRNAIRSILTNHITPEIIPTEKPIVIAMDCTYFGREFGLLIVIDVHTGKCLYCKEIGSYETIMDYQRAIMCLINDHHIQPKACIVDGKKGLYKMLEYYHIIPQLCQFHQLQTINQYLTRKPVLEPNIELRRIALLLPHSNYRDFYTIFNTWRWKYQTWLREKTYNPETGRREYTHQDTRKAARSILTNMPYLFTFEHYPELNIPNTNNKLEGINSVIKDKLRRHRGLSKPLKLQLVRSFLSSRTEINNNQ